MYPYHNVIYILHENSTQLNLPMNYSILLYLSDFYLLFSIFNIKFVGNELVKMHIYNF